MCIIEWGSDVCSSDLIAVRIGTLPDSSFIAQRLAHNRRMLCATPGYIADHGEPHELAGLASHRLLAASHQTPWRLHGPEGAVVLPVESVIRTNSSEVVREAMLAGLGIALRSSWDVRSEERRVGKEVGSMCRYGWSPYP